MEEREQQNDYTKGKSVVNKDFQCACLQILQEEGDDDEADDGGNGDADDERGLRQVEGSGVMELQEFRDFFGRGSGD